MLRLYDSGALIHSIYLRTYARANLCRQNIISLYKAQKACFQKECGTFLFLLEMLYFCRRKNKMPLNNVQVFAICVLFTHDKNCREDSVLPKEY